MKEAVKGRPSGSEIWTRYAGWTFAGAAALFVLWLTFARVDRIDYLTETESWSVAAPQEDSNSISGYEGGQRRLIVPGHHNPSYAWMMQTQLAFSEGKLRLRELGYDNAPQGRETHLTSPYRWYLSTLAGAIALFSDSSIGASVEQAARWADPLLHMLLVLSVTLSAAKRFGSWAAFAAAISLLGLFPLAANFVAGAPDVQALFWFLGVWSVLLLVGRPTKANFIVAGSALGMALWSDPARALPFTVSVCVGVLASSVLPIVSKVDGGTRYWRLWGISAAIVCVLGYLIEYFPSHLSWEVESIHLWHGLALLACGELAMRMSSRSRAACLADGITYWISVVLSVLALLAFAFVIWGIGDGIHFSDSPYVQELANHPSGTYAKSLTGWISRDGLTPAAWATLLPILVVGAGFALWLSGKGASNERRDLAFALIVASMAGVFACFYLSFWSVFNILLLPVLLLVFGGEVISNLSGAMKSVVLSIFLLVLLPGLALVGNVDRDSDRDLDSIEVQSVLERDLAYWLALQSDWEKEIVFSTPGVMESLVFYGGFRGIGSYAWENETGLEAASRIASASSMDEASILLRGREATYVALPSWDASLDGLIRRGRQLSPEEALPSNTLIGAIREWDLAPWLWPVPYAIPKEPGFEGMSAVVFRIGAEQEAVHALSRLGDYFLEQGLAKHALWTWDKLALYPRDVSALSTQAQISYMVGDRKMFQEKLDELLPYLSRRGMRTLPFDRRISLCITLVQGRQGEEAKEQLGLALSELDENRVAQLSASMLVRAFAMSKMLEIPIEDSKLRSEMIRRIPPSLRSRLAVEN